MKDVSSAPFPVQTNGWIVVLRKEVPAMKCSITSFPLPQRVHLVTLPEASTNKPPWPLKSGSSRCMPIRHRSDSGLVGGCSLFMALRDSVGVSDFKLNPFGQAGFQPGLPLNVLPWPSWRVRRTIFFFILPSGLPSFVLFMDARSSTRRHDLGASP